MRPASGYRSLHKAAVEGTILYTNQSVETSLTSSDVHEYFSSSTLWFSIQFGSSQTLKSQ